MPGRLMPRRRVAARAERGSAIVFLHVAAEGDLGIKPANELLREQGAVSREPEQRDTTVGHVGNLASGSGSRLPLSI